MAEIFGWFLEGHPLLTNRSMWRNFPMIRSKRWVKDNMVLLGDAKATAHFSIGSGTKLAMEDAIALADAMQRAPTVEAALRNTSRAAARRSRRPSTPPTCRWSGSSMSTGSGISIPCSSRSAS
jgi:2-polyprenyl-6-methoxyphenol hydroxylase-like FAD-dependent oxidoreductase